MSNETLRTTSQVLLLGLVAGLAAATGYLLWERWGAPQHAPEPEGYLDLRGPRPADGDGASARIDFQTLDADPAIRSLDLESHFRDLTLPAYDEAERHTLVLLGFGRDARGPALAGPSGRTHADEAEASRPARADAAGIPTPSTTAPAGGGL